jgi:hypothetical protein
MNQLRIQFAGDAQVYRLNFRYGRERMTAEQWFRLVLVDEDRAPTSPTCRPRSSRRSMPGSSCRE